MRTLHIGLQVGDLDRSLDFYEKVGYVVVGNVPATEFGSLTMLKLPTDPFLSLELVHNPNVGTITTGGLNHLVIQVQGMHDTVTRLAAAGVETSEPSSPDGPRTSGPPGSPLPMATGSSSSSGLPAMPTA